MTSEEEEMEDTKEHSNTPANKEASAEELIVEGFQAPE